MSAAVCFGRTASVSAASSRLSTPISSFIPIILIYRKYFGGRAAFRVTLILYVSMVVAGVIVDLIFAAAGLIPQGPRPENPIEHAMIEFNYTAWLNIAALIVGGTLFYLHFANAAKRQTGMS